MTEVLPRAIKKYGGIDADALRKAALEVDMPEGGTMLGFGVKFAGEGSPMAGQNERAFPVVIQYVDDKSYVVWPKSQAQREAVLPLPAGIDLRQPVGGPRRERRSRPCWSSKGLVKRFGGFTAVNNVSFKVDQGEILGLIGPNGSGKSTIFNMLSGTFPPTAGSIPFEGQRDRGAARRTRIINRGIGRTFQIPRPFRRLIDLRERGAGRLLRPGPPQPRQGRRLGRAGARHGRPADRPPTRRSTGWAPPA